MSARAAGDRPGPGSPVAAGERIAVLDVLRGVALLGIFIMNMPGFSHSVFAPPAADASAVDQAVRAVREALFAGKFNLLFGMLFGIGFTLQLARLDAAHGRGATWIYARRLAALLAIGLVHAVLLWSGDVLVVYAVLGFLLLAARRLPDSALLALLAICLVLPAAADALRPWLISMQDETIAVFEYEDFQAAGNIAFGRGSFLDAARETARTFAWGYTSPLGLFSIAAFYVQMATGILLGFLVGRKRWPERLDELGPGLRRAHFAAFAVVVVTALASFLFVTVPAATSTAATAATAATSSAAGSDGSVVATFVAGLLRTLGRAALMIVYALAVVRLLQRRPRAAWAAPFALAGRMPLSNYLLQTLMASAFFNGWGLGLWGRVGPVAETLLAIALFVLVQLPLSRWWLARWRYGPVEYLWRLVTYGPRAL